MYEKEQSGSFRVFRESRGRVTKNGLDINAIFRYSDIYRYALWRLDWFIRLSFFSHYSYSVDY